MSLCCFLCRACLLFWSPRFWAVWAPQPMKGPGTTPAKSEGWSHTHHRSAVFALNCFSGSISDAFIYRIAKHGTGGSMRAFFRRLGYSAGSLMGGHEPLSLCSSGAFRDSIATVECAVQGLVQTLSTHTRLRCSLGRLAGFWPSVKHSKTRMHRTCSRGHRAGSWPLAPHIRAQQRT